METDNLARDVLLAERLGYSSYGAFKADYPKTRGREEGDILPAQEAKKQTGREPELKQCLECGKPFVPKRKGMIYCSQNCCARKRMRERYQQKKQIKSDGEDGKC